MKWENVQLSTITDVLESGSRPKGGAVSAGIPSLGAEHLDGLGGFKFKKIKYVPIGHFKEMTSGILQKSDILIVKDGATTGKVSIVKEDFPYLSACINEHVFLLRLDSSKCLSRFCFHYLSSVQGQKELLSDFRGATVGGISRNILNLIKVPLPPLHIQQQIADTLDKADALRRKDQELLDKYDELAQAVFYEMFGDPVRNEKGWEIKSVIEMADCIVPGRDKPKSFTGKIPWITTEDLQHLNYTHKSKKGIGLTESEIKSARARKIPKNSIIMTCVGDLGVVSLAGFEMVVNQQLHTFQCKSINPIFLMFALSLQKNYMIKMASSTTLPYMNKTICNSIPIIAPPLKMQEVFSIFIKNLNSQIEKVKIGLELSNNLIKTQTNRCFNGS